MIFSKQEAINSFGRSESEALLAGKYIRSKMDFPDQEIVLSRLPDSNPFVRDYLTGICFANGWHEIWNRPKTSTISSSQKSTDWFVLTVERYFAKIQNHIQIRDSVNRAMLNGDWELAGQLLNDHIKVLGPTLWSLNWTILLFEESYGTARKKEYVNGFQNPDFGEVTQHLANLFSLSSDQTLTESSFRRIIANSIPEKGGFKNLLEMIFLEDCSFNWNLPDVLDFFEFFPLIDRYEIFIRLAAFALSENHKDSPRLIRAIKRISSKCVDSCTQYLVQTADHTSQITSVNGTDRLIAAWDAYLISKYDLCLEIATRLLEDNPEVLAAHELAVKSRLYLKKRENTKANIPASAISQNLENVFAKNDKSDDSLKYLQTFGRRFRIYSLSQPLRSLCANQSSNIADERQFRLGSYLYLTHGPRNFEYGHVMDVNLKYLKRCLAAYPSSISIQFFTSLAAGDLANEINGFNNIPKVRRFFFAGISAARQGNVEQGLAFLKGFLRLQKDDSENPLSPFAIEEARRSLVDIYRLKGDVVNMQSEVVNTLLERPQAVRRLPLSRIFEACQDQRQTASSHIEYPIIAYLACDNPHDIYIALKHFLYSNSVGKPSDLIGLMGISVKKLALLLFRVCTPEVIDSLDDLDSVSKVEAERLGILRWVRKNGNSLSGSAETEILRLVQHIQLRDALEKIDGARIVVNVSALREAERDRFKDIYLRFYALKEVATSKAHEQLNELINTISTMDIPEGKVLVIDSETLRPQRESTLKAFANAFLEIRNAFVYSAHFGIEASLSGRIRHGIVIQHIRKPFVEKHLAVLKDSTERQEIEKYWQQRLNCSTKPQIDQAMKVLYDLTSSVNSIAEEVKGEWLHSRTENKHPKGLFNFAFYSNELEAILNEKIQDVVDAEAFLDRIFDILLERTRSSLVTTREKINDDLRQKLVQLVDRAISSLAESPYSPFYLALRNDLSSCRQETERVCDQMMVWFQEADATLMGDAGLDLVLRTAVGMVEQLNPEARNKFNVEINTAERIRGRYFTSLVHIVFFMLDNARGHSDLKKSDFEAFVKLAVNNNRLTISIKSRMSSSESAAVCKGNLLAKVRQLEQAIDPETVIKEGGSGYAKIFAEIHYGFKQPYPMVTANCDNSNNLTVSVSCSLEGLSA